MENNINENQNYSYSYTDGGHQRQLPPRQENKRILAGVLAIVFGHLGVHKFVLGYNTEGIILLSISILGYITLCAVIGSLLIVATSIIGLIEGIIYLTKSDEEFYQMYQLNKKPWF